MSLEYRIGDVFERMAEIPDGSIDLIVTSPPFLALRSYLPTDHPDKAREIGSEATPAAFLDTLLALTAEWGRVLAPHGSLCVELGDTYSGSGGAGGDYDPETGLRAGQPAYKGSAARKDNRVTLADGRTIQSAGIGNGQERKGAGWPLAKSLTGIPTLYPWSLAYGRNLLTGQPSPAGQWRIRNLIVWARPNPPVGALGDKFRPATSYITVACRGAKRYFDLDAVRHEAQVQMGRAVDGNNVKGGDEGSFRFGQRIDSNPAGAPPLDWHTDNHPEDGDWLWRMSTQPYSGSFTTTRRVPCGPDDGGERIASASCLRHGDLPGQVPKALRDAHADSRSNRTQRNGAHPEPSLALDFAPTAPRSEPSNAQPSPCLVGADAATPHSKPSRRTGRALATTQPDTPSAQTVDGTAHTSAPPELSAPDHGTSESSNALVDSPASREPQTTADIADIPRSERPCTCSFERVITESSSHYATFPMALPKRLIEAMCPLRVCTECGRPSERIVGDAEYVKPNGQPHRFHGDGFETEATGANRRIVTGADNGNMTRSAPTLGWSDCGHDAWRTGVTLDPFAGSGTTLEAAQAVGRHAIGIDLDSRNADLARSRCGMFLDIDEGDRQPASTDAHNSTGRHPPFRVGYQNAWRPGKGRTKDYGT